MSPTPVWTPAVTVALDVPVLTVHSWPFVMLLDVVDEELLVTTGVRASSIPQPVAPKIRTAESARGMSSLFLVLPKRAGDR